MGLGRWDPLEKGLDPSCLGQPQSLCPNLGLDPTRSPPCRSCPGCRTQPFSDHSSCGSAGSQELAQLWWAHVFRSSLESADEEPKLWEDIEATGSVGRTQ